MPTPGANQRTIIQFLEAALQLASKLEIIIEHIDGTGRAISIHRARWDGAMPPIEEFRTSLWEAASHHASVLGGPQKFRIKAYDLDESGARSDVPIHLGAFVCEPASLAPLDPDAVMSEPATMQGLLAALMRHNQETHRLMIASTGALTSHLARTVENLSAQNERLMAEKVQQIVVMEQLMSHKDERELERMKTQAEIERKKEMWDKIAQLAPIAINKLAGQELIRQKHSELEATMMAFIETFNGTQLDQISKSGIFSERQMVLFGTVMEQVMRSMVTAKEKQEMATTAHKASVGDIGVAAASALFGSR